MAFDDGNDTGNRGTQNKFGNINAKGSVKIQNEVDISGDNNGDNNDNNNNNSSSSGDISKNKTVCCRCKCKACKGECCSWTNCNIESLVYGIDEILDDNEDELSEGEKLIKQSAIKTIDDARRFLDFFRDMPIEHLELDPLVDLNGHWQKAIFLISEHGAAVQISDKYKEMVRRMNKLSSQKKQENNCDWW